MGGIRKAAPPPKIFIPPKINQVTANRELSSSTTTSMSVTPQKPSPPPKVIGKKRKPTTERAGKTKMPKTIKSTLKIDTSVPKVAGPAVRKSKRAFPMMIPIVRKARKGRK